MEQNSHSQKRIYTRGGDGGETSIYRGPRVGKDHSRIELCGEIDELSAVLGLARCETLPPEPAALVHRIQRELIDFMTEIACLEPVRYDVRKIDRDTVKRLEDEIDAIEVFLPPLTAFVISGDGPVSARLHHARTVCRRAERRLVALRRREPKISETLLTYLNRLADLLFVMARMADFRNRKSDA